MPSNFDLLVQELRKIPDTDQAPTPMAKALPNPAPLNVKRLNATFDRMEKALKAPSVSTLAAPPAPNKWEGFLKSFAESYRRFAAKVDAGVVTAHQAAEMEAKFHQLSDRAAALMAAEKR